MHTVVSRLKELRRRRGLTAQQLADRMADAGIPWEYGVVAKLETGRRKSLSIPEWLALAFVLDVPPLTLLLPTEDAAYQVTPRTAAQSAAVGAWMTGAHPLLTQEPPEDYGDPYSRQVRYLAEWNEWLRYVRQAPAQPEHQDRENVRFILETLIRSLEKHIVTPQMGAEGLRESSARVVLDELKAMARADAGQAQPPGTGDRGDDGS